LLSGSADIYSPKLIGGIQPVLLKNSEVPESPKLAKKIDLSDHLRIDDLTCGKG
jgi:hypothetical protein